MRRTAILVVMAALGGACGGDEQPIGGLPGASPALSAPVPAPTTPPQVPEPPPPPPEGEQNLEGSLSVEVLDMQLFHPNTPHRELMDPRNTDRRTSERGSGFGLGVVLAATNRSEYILGAPRIISNLAIHGARGTSVCRVVPRRRSYWGRSRSPITILSPQVSERTPWSDETRSSLESVWRPQETLRIRAVLECGPIHVHDIAPTGLRGHFTLAARAPFVPHEVDCDRDHDVCDDDVVGSIDAIDVPARALSLQTMTLASGEEGYAAGDIFLYAEQGRARRVTLSDLQTSAFESQGGDLPATPPAVQDSLDEWNMNITGAVLRHWSDIPGTPKGGRVVMVTAEFTIDSGAIEGRLRGALTTAQTEATAAATALTAAEAAAAAAEPGSEADAAARAALRPAQARDRSASSALARARSTYERSLSSDRSRLARLMACDRAQLVTHARTVRATNARAVGAACRTLADDDSVSVTWAFVVGRYEVPVGLTYQLGRDPRTSFFAAQSLSTFDAR